jgi:hypothetical protein
VKRLLLAVLVTAFVTAAATVVTVSLTDSEPLTDWVKMAKLRIKGCPDPEAHLSNAKRIRGWLSAVGMHEPVSIRIREGISSPPDQSLAPEGVTLTPTATEMFILVRSYDFENNSREIYEFDLMKIMVDKDARKQLRELIRTTKAQSNEFGIGEVKQSIEW